MVKFDYFHDKLKVGHITYFVHGILILGISFNSGFIFNEDGSNMNDSDVQGRTVLYRTVNIIGLIIQNNYSVTTYHRPIALNPLFS